MHAYGKSGTASDGKLEGKAGNEATVLSHYAVYQEYKQMLFLPRYIRPDSSSLAFRYGHNDTLLDTVARSAKFVYVRFICITSVYKMHGDDVMPPLQMAISLDVLKLFTSYGQH